MKSVAFWLAISWFLGLAIAYAISANASGPRIKTLATLPGDYGNVWTFIAEPAPGLRVACVEATHSGGLWCTRREVGETW